jgi:hypothetical protein
MTIKQALKHKNKLAQKITDAFNKVKLYNSMEEGQNRPYDVEQSLDEYFKLTRELVELKTKIHTANMPVYGKIFEMSEPKSQVSKLKDLDCGEGKVRSYHRLVDDSTITKNAVISIVERDSMISKLEEIIESIQEQLDVHNATTHI